MMPTAENAASWSPHFPLGVSGSQFIGIGQQIKRPIKMVNTIHAMHRPITMNVAHRNLLDTDAKIRIRVMVIPILENPTATAKRNWTE